MNFMLSISPEQYGESIISTAGFMETLGFGAMMLAIGILTVFAVLAIIWGALILFKMVFHDLPEKRKTTIIAEEAPQVEVAPVVYSESEIVAVLAAAIAMAESESNDNIKFRVVSFKRK